MRSGIQKLTTVKIADNSEAAKPYKLTPKCIHVYGRQTANVGDKILITARGEMWKALVLATKVFNHLSSVTTSLVQPPL